jgi:predicted small secreted protein
MKKILIFSTAVIIGLVSSGCATWDGLKKDTNKAYTSTKESIHQATE